MGRYRVGQPRAFLMGEVFTAGDLAGRPVIRTCNSWSELNNCNFHLPMAAEAVKRGVRQAGGLSPESPAISLGEVFIVPPTTLSRGSMAVDGEVDACLGTFAAAQWGARSY